MLAQGRLIAQGTPAQVTRDAAVVEAYLGHGAAARRAGARRGTGSGGGTMSGLLEVQGLRAGYGRTEVLRGVDLSVGQGEIVVLLGSNGASKIHAQQYPVRTAPALGRPRALRRLGPDRPPLPRRGARRPDPGAGGAARVST